MKRESLSINAGDVALDGDLVVPDGASGLIVFAHGSGSSRHSPRNRHVAQMLNDAGFATLLLDLLTIDEEVVDQYTRHLCFDIGLLSERLVGAIDWVKAEGELRRLPVGLFGASTGAAATIIAAAHRPEFVSAVVSRGGRPDLSGASMALIKAPTLLIVGGDDYAVVDLNRQAFERMQCMKRLDIVPGATHLFEEPGTLDKVAELAADWFAMTIA